MSEEPERPKLRFRVIYDRTVTREPLPGVVIKERVITVLLPDGRSRTFIYPVEEFTEERLKADVKAFIEEKPGPLTGKEFTL